MVMRLAEALSERAAAVRRIEALRSRVIGSARYQEGDSPAEDPAALLSEIDDVLDVYEDLMRRINRTNSTTRMGSDETLTDALARRDALRLRHHVLKSAADAGAGNDHGGYVRQLRSELKMLSALPVAELRAQVDSIAQQHRELDVRIQQRNWEVDLAD
jgi:hypothetical protein